jgi:multidrug efflux system outer membrane protein
MRCAMSDATRAIRWRWPLPVGVFVAMLLAGCATRPPQVLTQQLVPTHFIGAVRRTARVWPRSGWWRRLGSPELTRLIRAAHANNRNLAAAAARLREAHAEVMIERAVLFPQFEGQTEAVRSGVGHAATLPSGQSVTAGNSFGLDVEASYGLDVWGMSRDNLRAAEEGVKTARFARRALALTVTADVADVYFDVLALREQLAITKQDITAIDAILNVVKLKVKAGTVSHLDLAQEQAQVQSIQAQLPVVRQQLLQQRVTLAVLVGAPPEMLHLKMAHERTIRLPPVRPGLPSELLLRRPDVAQAEANLAAAHANLQAARAAFLPQLTLNGSAGFGSAAVNTLLQGPNLLWDTGAQLVQTIFDGGRFVGEKDLAYATQEALVADYENAVLQAYADVETALGQVSNDQQEEVHLRAEVAAAREAFRIAELQYREGAAHMLTVLQAQQTLFAARDQLVTVHLAHMQAVIHLYEALGGGWTEHAADRTQYVLRR